MEFDEKGRFVPSTKIAIIPRRDQVPVVDTVTKGQAEFLSQLAERQRQYEILKRQARREA